MCKVADCDGAPHGHGLCNRHYRNWARYGDPTPDVGHKGKRKGCSLDCTCGRHSMKRGRVDSLPCGHCGTVRQVNFQKGPEGNDPDRFCNRDCYAAWSAGQREVRRRTTGVSFHYDMSTAEFFDRLAAQDGVCVICSTPIDEKTAHRDHCHSSGEWRGLLCGSCNRGLGLFRDSPDILMAAAAYLLTATDVLAGL